PGERILAACPVLGESRQGPVDFALDGLEAKPQALENRGGDPLAVADQPEQDVLGPYEVVAEPAGFLSGEDDDASRALGESLEHVVSSTPGILAPGNQAMRPLGRAMPGGLANSRASLYMAGTAGWECRSRARDSDG